MSTEGHLMKHLTTTLQMYQGHGRQEGPTNCHRFEETKEARHLNAMRGNLMGSWNRKGMLVEKLGKCVSL